MIEKYSIPPMIRKALMNRISQQILKEDEDSSSLLSIESKTQHRMNISVNLKRNLTFTKKNIPKFRDILNE